MEHFEVTMQLLTDSVRSIDDYEFIRLKTDCLATLKAGRKIIASGLGKNVPVCEKFAGTLTSMGIPASFLHTNSAVHGDLGIVRDGDLIIVLTKSGETSESIHLVRMLKKRKCLIWLLSFSRDSTLCREVENRLIVELEHEGDPWNILPNNSTSLNLIILQELAMQLISELKIHLDVLRANHPGGAIGAQLAENKIL